MKINLLVTMLIAMSLGCSIARSEEPHKWSTTTYVGAVAYYAPATRIVFGKDGHQGWLDWSKGKITFGGDLDAAAKGFFEYLKPSLEKYIEDYKCQQKIPTEVGQ